MKLTRWTKDEDNLIIKNTSLGLKQLQQLLPNRTESSIHARKVVLRKKNPELVPSNAAKWTDEEDKILLENYDIMQMKDICEHYLQNRTIRAARKRGLDLKKRFNLPNKRNQWTREEDVYLMENYGKIKTGDILINLSNRTIEDIHYRVQKLGVRGTPGLSRSFAVNDSFFDEPNLENCYWAGFIAADGCISRKNRVALALGEYDKEAIDNLKEKLCFSGPIHKVKCLNKRTNHIVYRYDIVVSSNNIVNKLQEHWNITPRKTLTLQPPRDYIKDELALAYIIGYFDGDGSWLIKPKFDVRFTGTKFLLEWIKSYIDKYSPIKEKNKPINVRPGNGNCFDLSIRGLRGRVFHQKLLEIQIPFRLTRKWDQTELLKYQQYRKIEF
jgi:hypothetical protein